MRAKQFIFDGSTNNYAGYVVGNQNQRKFTSMDDVPEKVATSYLGKVDPETERQKFVRQDNAQQQAAITQNGRQPMYRDHGAQNVSQVGDRPGDQGKIVVDRTPTNNMVNTVTGDTAQGSSTTDSLGQSSTRGGGGYGQGEKTVTTQANIENDRRGSTYKPPSEASSLMEPTWNGRRDSQFELIRPHAAAIDKAAAEKFADPNDKTTKLAQAERTRKFEKTASDMIKTNANAMKSAVDDNSDEVRSIENGRHVVRRPDRRVVDLGNNAGPGKLTTGTMATDVNRAGNQAAEVAYKQRKAPAVVRSSAPAAAAATSYSAPTTTTPPAPTPVATAPTTPTVATGIKGAGGYSSGEYDLYKTALATGALENPLKDVQRQMGRVRGHVDRVTIPRTGNIAPTQDIEPVLHVNSDGIGQGDIDIPAEYKDQQNKKIYAQPVNLPGGGTLDPTLKDISTYKGRLGLKTHVVGDLMKPTRDIMNKAIPSMKYLTDPVTGAIKAADAMLLKQQGRTVPGSTQSYLEDFTRSIDELVNEKWSND